MTDKTPAEEVLCPVALTLSLIGGKWKALILWNLLEGTMRYSALRKAVPDATPKMLTPTGESIKPILTAMYRWGDAYLAKRNRKSCCSMKPPADE